MSSCVTVFRELPEGVLAGFTHRHGGVSTAPYDSLNLAEHVGDLSAHVAQNRQAFVGALPHAPEAVQWLDQVHGDQVVEVPAGGIVGVPKADAMFTDQKRCLLGILTADCVPVVIYASDGSCVAAAHAGWRGLQLGVLAQLVSRIQARTKHSLQAIIGPCISAARYEVGEDVWAHFVDEYPAAVQPHAEDAQKRELSIANIAHQQLCRLGVTVDVTQSQCSYSEAHLYSYRRSSHAGEAETGRVATFVMALA